MNTRVCTKFGVAKPGTLEFFGPQKHGADGLHSHCRMCRRIEARERKQAERNGEALGADVDNGPAIPIERTQVAPGITQVKFGIGWKPTRDHHTTPGMLGYNSPLNAII